MTSDANQSSLNTAQLVPGERQALIDRRRLAKVAENAPTVGLALSGGGIRSATFSLGLLRGLAARGLLAKIDILSTVSGGGYVGAMIGRLFSACSNQNTAASDVTKMLADPSNLLLWWLRRNGRYLTPTGAKDFALAVATYLRAVLAVQFEFSAVALIVGALISIPHLSVWAGWFPVGPPDAVWQTLWWPLAVWLIVAFAPVSLTGYWTARVSGGNNSTWPNAAFAAFLFILCAVLWRARTPIEWPSDDGNQGTLRMLFANLGTQVALSSATAGALIGMTGSILWGTQKSTGSPIHRLRWLFTQALRMTLVSSLVVFGIGGLDWMSWELLGSIVQPGEHSWLLGSVSVGPILIIAARALSDPLQRIFAQTLGSTSRHVGSALVGAIGITLFLAILLGWLALTQGLIFLETWRSGWNDLDAVLRCALLFAIGVGWLLLTGSNRDSPNATSLHGFYLARLTRSYLSVANPARFPNGCAVKATDAQIAHTRRVTELVQGDDIGLSEYQPEVNGGPIHLINVCINRNRDDRTGLFESDRKGTSLTVSHRGFEIGSHTFVPVADSSDVGTLGRWIAISGAAASTGAGAMTTLGSAMLLFFTGVRLGYWWKAPDRGTVLRPLSASSRFAWRVLGKPFMLISEVTANFRGTARPAWFLSDGGHFENTGVYPLIRRELDFILLADCGTDPRFAFADIENLVRKVRIDFGATIDFYAADEAQPFLGHNAEALTILSPYQLASNATRRGALLARITYENGKRGTLLVIKPNLHTQLDLDVMAYARKNAAFPQQPTSDQFFEEAQWESYHRLGRDFAMALSDSWLENIPGWTSKPHVLTIPAALTGAPDGKGSVVAPDAQETARSWRAAAASAAVGTTVGIGVSGTLLVSGWQIFDQIRQDDQTQVQYAEKLFRDVADKTAAQPTIDLPSHPGLRFSVQQMEDLLATGRLKRPLLENVKGLLESIRSECEKRINLHVPVGHSNPADDFCLKLTDHRETQTADAGPLYYWFQPGTRGWDQLASLSWGQTISRLPDIPPPGRPASPTSPEPPPPVEGPVTPPVVVAPPSPLPGNQATVELGNVQNRQIYEKLLNPDGIEAPAPQSTSHACRRTVTDSYRLYTQIYDEDDRGKAKEALSAIQSIEPELITPAIENVALTALRKGRTAPVAWPRWTVIFHDKNSVDCATSIGQTLRQKLNLSVQVMPLPKTLKPVEGVIELWIPPNGSGSAGGGW